MKNCMKKSPMTSSIVIFLICLAVHIFDCLVLRTDETILGENFLNKLFGIFVVVVLLHVLRWKWCDIGFSAEKFPKYFLLGLVIGACFFFMAFLLEIMILRIQGSMPHLEFFISGFSLTGAASRHTGVAFILMCIGFNLINVWMEEGLFRGFFIRLMERKHTFAVANAVAALLFGIWHIPTALRSFLNGEITTTVFLVLGIGYMILAGLMGIKWGLLYRMTGTIWAGMGDHFFNNCIATNLLHVVTDSGVDEMQIVRVMTAQVLSFASVIMVYRRWLKADTTNFAEEK